MSAAWELDVARPCNGAARSERKRASAEQRRFEATHFDQLRATLIDERRKLLDSSSLLFVKLDETTSLVFGQDGQSQSNPHGKELRREFANVSACLRLWCGVGPEGAAVVTASDAVKRTIVDVYSAPTVDRIHAN